jgi:hypothetical protein
LVNGNTAICVKMGEYYHQKVEKIKTKNRAIKLKVFGSSVYLAQT